MKDEYDFSGGVRGALFSMPPRYSRITLWMDDEVMDWFRDQVDRAGGGDYQCLINDVLREHIRQRESMEDMFRRVLREELAATATASSGEPTTP
jgi:hypothetical protein